MSGASLTLTNGFGVGNDSSLGMTALGGPVTLNGSSYVLNDSTFTASGGKYNYAGNSFTLNGSLTVGNNSIANFNNAPLHGPGTVNINAGSIVDMHSLLAGLHVDVGSAGRLFLQSPNDAGTINEAPGGFVFVGGAATSAAREVFHQATGVMDLLNRAGAQVSSVQFAPGSHEYASTLDLRTAGGVVTGSMEITANPHFPGNLPTTFTH
jgi:hypothetical protein